MRILRTRNHKPQTQFDLPYFCNMQVDHLIIGQGICGTFLSWYLQKAGSSFIIIDESKPFTASKAAAGIINPVTGRRIVKTWMIDELLPFLSHAYQQIGNELDIDCIAQKKIIDFFPTPQMRNAFFERYEEDRQYLNKPLDETAWIEDFNYDFGFGEIQPCYLVDLTILLSASRKKLITQQQLLQERFNITELLITENKIQYKDIIADKIIFCDGIESLNNPYFKNLPFAPNKGEALIVEIKDIPPGHIYKKGITIVPWKDELFWVGSSYEWEFQNDQPTEVFRKKTEMILQQWLNTPFRVMEQIGSVRPATLERRPFVGFHPLQKNIGIFNGMGTKGCSLAPFFAKQLVEYLAHNIPILPEANVKRFSGVLSKTPATF